MENSAESWCDTRSNTDINLTYEAKGERGTIFFESRVLAPAFIEESG
jgi:hypothetical protein